jgi:hypothetical protein
MKKVAVGCGLVLVALVLAGSIGGYLAVRKVESAVSGFSSLRTIPELNRSVKNQRPFTPPASGELTEPQLGRLLRVQEVVHTRLGERVQKIAEKYEKFLREDHVVTGADAPALVAAYSDLATALVDGKRAQVEALNAEGISLEEYRWIRAQAYGAAQIPLMDFERLIDDVQSGREPAQALGTLPLEAAGSAATQAKVAPHRKALERYAALAYFGL